MLRLKYRHYLIIAEVRPPIHRRLHDTETKTSSKIEFSGSLEMGATISMLDIERCWAVSFAAMEGMPSIENEMSTPNHSLDYVVIPKSVERVQNELASAVNNTGRTATSRTAVTAAVARSYCMRRTLKSTYLPQQYEKKTCALPILSLTCHI